MDDYTNGHAVASETVPDAPASETPAEPVATAAAASAPVVAAPDVDAWLAQRVTMIAALNERERQLLEQLEATRQALTMLGVREAPKAASGGPAAPARNKSRAKAGAKRAGRPIVDAGQALLDKVRAVLRAGPVTSREVAEKTKMNPDQARTFLMTLVQGGEVKRVGRGGSQFVIE